MNEMIKEFLFFGAAVSIMGYELGLFLKAKFKSPDFQSTVDIHYRSHDIFIRFPH